jgi:hypothetical protein
MGVKLTRALQPPSDSGASDLATKGPAGHDTRLSAGLGAGSHSPQSINGIGSPQSRDEAVKKEAPAPPSQTGRGKMATLREIGCLCVPDQKGFFPNRHSDSRAPQKSASDNAVRLLALNFSFYYGCLLEHHYPCSPLFATSLRTAVAPGRRFPAVSRWAGRQRASVEVSTASCYLVAAS